MAQAPFGIDYAWGRPTLSSMNQAKVQFAMRYLSHDTSKNLSHGEAEWLTNNGIWIGCVWETTADRMLSGKSAGITDAQEAERQARTCGMPDGRPIYFGCDFDANESQQDEIDAYLKGCASVIGLPRVGMYAGYYPLSRSFDHGTITYGWQTYAWSGGHLSTRANLYQYSNGHDMGGCDVDYNYAYSSDYGQWKLNEVPNMAFTAADAKTNWKTDNIIPSSDTDYDNPTGDNPYKTAAFHLWEIGNRLRGVQTTVETAETVVLTPEQITAIAAAVSEQVIAAVTPGLAAGIADELADRLAE